MKQHHPSHNGTVNGIHSQRRARQERAEERPILTRAQRLARLNAGNYKAVRERARLNG